MIIKKKYTISDTPKVEHQIIEEKPDVREGAAVQTPVKQNENIKQEQEEKKEEEKQKEEKSEEKNLEKKDSAAEEQKKEKQKADELDFSLDNIKFPQREERREGTRRRGYRRTQDRNVISRAQEDAKSIKEQAKQDGYKEGIENAKKELEELKGKFAEFYKYKDEIFDKVSGCIFDISVEIAGKILNKEIETDKTAVIKMIKSAVEEVNKTENKIVLKVMPQDVEIVKNKVPEIFEGEGFEASISVVPDKTIKEGGVIVETSNGIIDATVQTQLVIMEKALCSNKEDKT